MKASDLAHMDEDALERLIRVKRGELATVDYDGSHLAFMRNTWLSYEPFIVGFHTREICKAIDQAFDDFRHGKSTYLLINVHHRVGKSTIISRYAPAHFIGEFPNHEVIQCSYSQSSRPTSRPLGGTLSDGQIPRLVSAFRSIRGDEQEG